MQLPLRDRYRYERYIAMRKTKDQNQLASADDTTIMNDTPPTASTHPKVKKNKIRPKLKPIVSTDDDDDEGLGYGEWKKPASAHNTPTTSPQPKAKKKLKIRPKLKPIVSTDEGDEDEGLGYGEWAPSPKPSPIKPRQISESGSEEDDAIHAIQKISSNFLQPPPTTTSSEMEEKEEIIQPEARVDNDVGASSRPITQSKRDFDNKLQFFENNTGGEKVKKVSDNRASTTNATTHTQQQQKGTEAEVALEWCWSRIWKGSLVLFCIAICCEVLSIAIIIKMSLSHNVGISSDIGEEALLWNKELTSNNATIDENIAGEVLWSSREENEEVPVIELLGIEGKESVERTIENILPPEEATMSVISVADDGQYIKKDEGSSVNGLNELVVLEEDATEDDTHPEIEISLSPEEERETQARHDEYPCTQEDDGSESDFDPEVEEHLASPEGVAASSETTAQIVPVTNDEDIDSNSTLEVAYDEVSGDESNANEQAGIRLAEEEDTEATEKVDDEQPSAIQTPESEPTVNDLPDTDNKELEAVEEYLSPAGAVLDDIEHHDEASSEQEDEGSESLASEPPETDSDKLETEEEEHLMSSEEVPVSAMIVQMAPETIDGELDAQITLDPSGNEELGEELDANGLADTNLVEVEAGMKVEASDNNKQPEPAIEPSLKATDGYERDSTSVEEASTGDMQPTAHMNDAVMPAAEAELDENEHAQIELIEEETTSEDGSDQPKPEGMSSVGDNNHVENADQNVDEDVPQKQPVLPRTSETKHEFLSQLEKFEEAFESYEVIDALVGHVATAVPKLLLKRILGAAMKVKERLSRRKKKQLMRRE